MFYRSDIAKKELENIPKGLIKAVNNGLKLDTCCHAEEHAINKYKKIPISRRCKLARKTLTIMVIRVSRTGVLGNSKPCANCLALMKRHRITRVIYSDEHGELVTEKVARMETTHLSLAYRSLLTGDYNVEYKDNAKHKKR